ncbi:hypothetical protein PUN28_015150 [Cardiocondyla obscurior]|uniref:Uncharacterized protein n=1 Tax=Cardiocondyla obscurior TaxID=286306 RepID=A0AAW2F3B0_9HYME
MSARKSSNIIPLHKARCDARDVCTIFISNFFTSKRISQNNYVLNEVIRKYEMHFQFLQRRKSTSKKFFYVLVYKKKKKWIKSFWRNSLLGYATIRCYHRRDVLRSHMGVTSR